MALPACQGLYDAVGALSNKIGRWEGWREDQLPAVPRVHRLGVAVGAGYEEDSFQV